MFDYHRVSLLGSSSIRNGLSGHPFHVSPPIWVLQFWWIWWSSSNMGMQSNSSTSWRKKRGLTDEPLRIFFVTLDGGETQSAPLRIQLKLDQINKSTETSMTHRLTTEGFKTCFIWCVLTTCSKEAYPLEWANYRWTISSRCHLNLLILSGWSQKPPQKSVLSWCYPLFFGMVIRLHWTIGRDGDRNEPGPRDSTIK